MKNTAMIFVVLWAILFNLFGCGGGSNTSAFSPNISSSTSETSTPLNPIPSSLEGFTNSLTFNPSRDFGLGIGENVCFRIKSYNNIAISDFSNAICSQIKNDQNLTLAWDDGNGDTVGYYVYFGSNEEDATEFLVDIMQS